MASLKNGCYWHAKEDGAKNLPSNWGFLIKFGFDNGNDYSALYFERDGSGFTAKISERQNERDWIYLQMFWNRAYNFRLGANLSCAYPHIHSYIWWHVVMRNGSTCKFCVGLPVIHVIQFRISPSGNTFGCCL